MAAGHGGQVVLSQSTRDLLDDSFALSDLGEHRLKDLSGPQRIYQLGADGFPPLKTLHRTNLPIPATAFLGRERELDEVRRAFACRRAPADADWAGRRRQDAPRVAGGRPRLRMRSPTASGGCRLRRCVTRASCCRRSRTRSALRSSPAGGLEETLVDVLSGGRATPAPRQPRASSPGCGGRGGVTSRCGRGDGRGHEQGASPARGRARVRGGAAGGSGGGRAVPRADRRDRVRRR